MYYFLIKKDDCFNHTLNNNFKTKNAAMNDKEINNGPETWVDDHGDYLLQYAYVRLRNSAAAEDAVQEPFLAG